MSSSSSLLPLIHHIEIHLNDPKKRSADGEEKTVPKILKIGGLDTLAQARDYFQALADPSKFELIASNLTSRLQIKIIHVFQIAALHYFCNPHPTVLDKLHKVLETFSHDFPEGKKDSVEFQNVESSLELLMDHRAQLEQFLSKLNLETLFVLYQAFERASSEICICKPGLLNSMFELLRSALTDSMSLAHNSYASEHLAALEKLKVNFDEIVFRSLAKDPHVWIVWIKRMETLTDGIILVSDFPWQYGTIFGGIIEQCTRETEFTGFGVSDVDILCQTPEDIVQMVQYFAQRLCVMNLKGYLTFTPGGVLISIEQVKRHFCIMTTDYHSAGEFLSMFDFAHNQAIFNGKAFLGFPKTEHAWKEKSLIRNPASGKIPEHRLYKAFAKGYTNNLGDAPLQAPPAAYVEFQDFLKTDRFLAVKHGEFFPLETNSPVDEMVEKNRGRLIKEFHATHCLVLDIFIPKEKLLEFAQKIKFCYLNQAADEEDTHSDEE